MQQNRILLCYILAVGVIAALVLAEYMLSDGITHQKNDAVQRLGALYNLQAVISQTQKQAPNGRLVASQRYIDSIKTLQTNPHLHDFARDLSRYQAALAALAQTSDKTIISKEVREHATVLLEDVDYEIRRTLRKSKELRNQSDYYGMLLVIAVSSLLLLTTVCILYPLVRKNRRDTQLLEKKIKEQAAQLVAEDTKYRTAVNTAVDGFVMIDQYGTIQQVNDACATMFGYDEDDLVDQNVSILMPSPYHEEHDDYLSRYRQTREARIIGIGREVSGRHKNGEIFPVELSVGQYELNGDLYFSGILRDISERKAAEREREKLIVALKQSNDELDDFAYIASHDLKEPLRGLYNNACFLVEDHGDVLNDDAKRRIERMQFLCKRMDGLMDSLLYFSRIGRQGMAMREVNLDRVLNSVLELIEPLLQEKDAAIIRSNTLPRVQGDATRLSEVFNNLITNAVKYNKNAYIQVEIGCLPKWRGYRNVIFVRDNGIGIPKEFHEDIFKIFKRLNEEDDATKGSGVGLTFVKKIIERHGGQIWLDSQIGKGSTFYFTLPETSGS